MPAWSPQVANVLVKMALKGGKPFNQMQLQELVYIAHGWCLAMSGQPLTGDRPEALEHGPEYRRLAEALANWGVEPVTAPIEEISAKVSRMDATLSGDGVLSPSERNILARVYAEYGQVDVRKLATVTRA